MSKGKIHWGKISQTKMAVNTVQKSFVRFELRPPSKWRAWNMLAGTMVVGQNVMEG